MMAQAALAPTPTISAPAVDIPGAPRLTRLELQGFKSFATKTVFVFERGITAIVGPNGSGKSNVSDAVRWVLGEQSHGALRSKRTEDVIFAGGQGRAPTGLAEVSVTFDNREGWLPIDFTEVTVTRRAFRGGENQYLINGRRVRLKDVTQLTASLGQSHLVVGQGLVDAALSQRAEERRGLFEHAADLTGLRLKAAEAERNLTETEANIARLTDLLAELAPRLRSLERAARQAREWRGVHEHLVALQREHYGRLLRIARDQMTAAGASERAAEAAVAERQGLLDRHVAEERAARVAVDDCRAALAQYGARRQTAIDAARRIAHERDLAAERQVALSKRRDDMADTQAGLDEQVAAVAAQLGPLTADLAAIEAELTAARRRAADLTTAGRDARQTHADLERRLTEVTAQIAERERALVELDRRRALIEQRRDTDAAERSRLAALAADRNARLERLRTELLAAAETERADAAALVDLEAELRALATAADRAVTEARAAQEAREAIERRLSDARTRLDVLRRLHESGAGLHAGVKATLAAARAGQLRGVRGTVAELLSVPPAFETAIEVALGGHLHDIVVDRWVDAEAAIAHLRQNNAGRATFQPLDTVRRRGGPAAGSAVLGRPGILGVAAKLVEAEPDLTHVVTSLLGRVVVAADLPTARAVISALGSGWSVVTVTGEIARGGGSVTGGAAVRESGILSRERELRELPAEITRLTGEGAKARAAAEAAADGPRRIAAERQAIESRRAAHLAAGRERRTQRERLAAWLEELRAEQDAAERRAAGLDTAATNAGQGLAALDDERTRLNRELAEAGQALTDLQSALQQTAATIADQERDLVAEQRRLAGLDERLRSERRREAGLRAQEHALAEESATRAQRAAALDGERAAVAAQLERLEREAATADRARREIEAERAPLERAARDAEQSLAKLVRALETARTDLLDCERAHGSASLAAERARGELATIRQRIVDDLELADPDALLDAAGDGETPWAALSAEDLAAREREIATLKERLRRVGYVGDDAVAEHEREAEHQGFLQRQLADVEGASASLRALLAELHATMRSRFDETFAQVAERFAETFSILFGGGSARLILTAGDDESAGGRGAPGVDIVAQPPGKRLQSLALLSGGERALTAAALLIAILRVNPTPFCLLDEVDAALDEANIVRFRDQLRALAAETQVIVITHNRGTIEIADTLYGVSMGDDGVSRVLSLRLAETAAD